MVRRLRLGMVGGGDGAFIGAVHRAAARLADRYELVAGAFSADPEKSKKSGQALGLPAERVYADFAAMAAAESARGDGVEAVSIVVPNNMHFVVAEAFLRAGVDVICDKPLSATLAEARALETIVAQTGRLLILTHNYAGYPMVREARARVASGEIGDVRLVQVEYTQDWLTDALETLENKQALWRTDPGKGGAGGCLADIGTHAHHLACYVAGKPVVKVSADLSTFVRGRRVPDNAHVMMRFADGARGIMWISQVAPGNRNALRLRVYGSKGGLVWEQEEPERLILLHAGGPDKTLWRGLSGLDAVAERASRLPAGHPEGYLEAFAACYADAAELIITRRDGRVQDTRPTPVAGIAEGVAGLAFIEASLASSANGSSWTDVVRSVD